MKTIFEKYMTSIADVINTSELERLAGIPPKTIYKWLAGAQSLPWHHTPAILIALCQKFGAVFIEGKTITFENGSFHIVWNANEPPEIQEEGNSFVYIQRQYKSIGDEFDTFEFLKTPTP